MIRRFRFIATLVIIWFVVDQVSVNLDRLAQVDLRSWAPQISLFLMSCFLLFVTFLLSALVWREMIKDVGRMQVQVVTAISIYLSANICRYVPGKIWQIGGLAYFSQQSGIPKDLSILSAVLGQLLALSAASILGVYAIVTSQTSLIPDPLTIAMLVIGSVLIVKCVGFWALKKIIAERPDAVLYPWECWKPFMLKWFSLYLCNWILYAVSFYLFCASIGFETNFFLIGSAFAGAYVLGYIALLAPAGLGVREVSLAVLLSPIMLTEEALVLALLARVWTTFVEVIPGLPLLIAQLQKEKKSSL